MSSFSLELQVRASQELVAEHMPKRSIFLRATLFAEVASALLFIQVGLFTHPAMIVVPFLIMAFVALQRVDYVNVQGEDQHSLCDPRGFFLSLITPKNYSIFGLRTRQQGTKFFVWPMMLVRLICAIVIGAVLFGSCHACPSLVHRCQYYYLMKRYQLFTEGIDACWRDFTDFEVDERPSGWHSKMCHETRPWDNYVHELVPTDNDLDSKVIWTVFPPPNVSGEEGFLSLCDKEGIIPGMLKESCKKEAVDPVYYQTCVDNTLFPGTCNGRFLFCSLISETMSLEKSLILLYVLAPLAGFFLVLPLRFGGCLFGMMSVPENKGLKRAITARARQLEQELRSGKLQNSLWWDRRTFEFKIGFAAIDVILDAGSCFNFMLADAYIFAGCQLVIIVVSSYIQLRKVGPKLYSAIQESWKVGLASNEVHAFLLQEKTFEAPLSLFFQFSTAFYLSDNFIAFAILFCSIFTSLGGITNGLYIANHLSFVDVEEVDLDLCHSPQAVIFNAGFPQPESNSPQNGHPAPQAGLQPTQLPPPPGLQPTQLPPPPCLPRTQLPSPPGLPRTQLPPPAGLQPNKRRPGQFASDTE